MRAILASLLLFTFGLFVLGIASAAPTAPGSEHMEILDEILTTEVSAVDTALAHAGCEPPAPPAGYYYVGCIEWGGNYYAEYHPYDPPKPVLLRPCP